MELEVPEFESLAIVASCSITLSTCNMPATYRGYSAYLKEEWE